MYKGKMTLAIAFDGIKRGSLGHTIKKIQVNLNSVNFREHNNTLIN